MRPDIKYEVRGRCCLTKHLQRHALARPELKIRSPAATVATRHTRIWHGFSETKVFLVLPGSAHQAIAAAVPHETYLVRDAPLRNW